MTCMTVAKTSVLKFGQSRGANTHSLSLLVLVSNVFAFHIVVDTVRCKALFHLLPQHLQADNVTAFAAHTCCIMETAKQRSVWDAAHQRLGRKLADATQMFVCWVLSAVQN